MNYYLLLKSRVSIVILCCILFSAACNKNNRSDHPDVVSLATTATYTLVWSDEFDGNQVNTSNWNFETGGGGWGNNEKEYYQASNATVSNGNLVITAKKERVKSSA